MPDAKAGSFAMIDGNEFVNSSRTVAYIKNFGLPITVNEDCWCPNLRDLLDDCPAPTGMGCEPFKFPSNCPTQDTTPMSDPAPWYDPAIPESGDFLGFLPTEFTGLGSTFSRSTTATAQGGSVLGKLTAKERTLTWKGYLFGRTCCAAEYGLRWLTAQLSNASGCDGCAGADLDILFCCPETSGQVTGSVACGTTNPNIPDIGTMKADDAFRTFHKVGLADGPHQNATRTLGCGTCEDQGTGCIIECEFSLVAGNPYGYRKPVVVCGPQGFPSCGICPGEADQNFWRKATTTAYPAAAADAAGLTNCLIDCQQTPADCLTDPSCPTPSLPTIPGFTDPCGCDPYNTAKFCCEISNDVYGQFFEGIPQINVFSGDEDLHNVNIKFYENPQQRTCTDQSLFDVCNLCDTVNIRFVPKNSTLKIDGLTRKISIECPGNNVNSAESLVTSTFRWPVLKCVGYIATVEADCNWPISTKARVTICVIPQEMV